MSIRIFGLLIILLSAVSCGGDSDVIVGSFDGSWVIRVRFNSATCDNPSDTSNPDTVLIVTQTESEITAIAAGNGEPGAPSLSYRGTASTDNSSFSTLATYNNGDCRGSSTIEFTDADLDSGVSNVLQIESYTCGSGESILARNDYYCGTATRE